MLNNGASDEVRLAASGLGQGGAADTTGNGGGGAGEDDRFVSAVAATYSEKMIGHVMHLSGR